MTVKEYMKKWVMTETCICMDKVLSQIMQRPRLVCNDGYSISVQGSGNHYCTPRANLLGADYDEVELGFPSEPDSLINEYAEDPTDYTGTVYGWVPMEIVEELIKKHGGIKGPDEEALKRMEECVEIKSDFVRATVSWKK